METRAATALNAKNLVPKQQFLVSIFPKLAHPHDLETLIPAFMIIVPPFTLNGSKT